MTPDQLVQALEAERARIRPGRYAGRPDTPEICAARLAELDQAAAEFDTPKSKAAKRRAHDRARQAAGL